MKNATRIFTIFTNFLIITLKDVSWESFLYKTKTSVDFKEELGNFLMGIIGNIWDQGMEGCVQGLNYNI